MVLSILGTCRGSLAKQVQDIVPCHELIQQRLLEAAVAVATQKIREGHGTSKVSEAGTVTKGVWGALTGVLGS